MTDTELEDRFAEIRDLIVGVTDQMGALGNGTTRSIAALRTETARSFAVLITETSSLRIRIDALEAKAQVVAEGHAAMIDHIVDMKGGIGTIGSATLKPFRLWSSPKSAASPQLADRLWTIDYGLSTMDYRLFSYVDH
jgi:hypothetical protein